MKTWEKQLMKHILNEKYLGETDKVKIQKEDKKSFLQAVANFHQIGEMIFSNAKLKEVSETLSNIVQQAEAITMQESENWFDNVTVSRHMKQMNEAYKVFEKTANEMHSLQQRLESAYDDMGTVLNRYYKVNNALSEDDYTAGVDDGEAGISLEEDEYTAGIDDGRAGVSLEEDQYTAGVHDYGPAFHDHITKDKVERKP